MKPASKLLIAGLAAFALPLSAPAASVSWGPVQSLTGATNIVSTDVSSLAGANFGVTTGTTTIVNNGSVDVEFKSLRSGQNATLSNGINVAAASAWANWGFANGNSAVTNNFGVVLDSNLGIEDPGPTSADITLSGLTIGTRYQIQFFADSTGNNNQTISGSGAMNTLTGQFVTGTFTADATTQVLTMTRSTDFGVANALTIGTLTTADTTPPTLSGSSIVDDQSGGPVIVNAAVTYTVTFSEDMNAATVAADDFENAGSSTIAFGTITEPSPGVFSVPVTPTSTGTLQLQVKAGAILKDDAGNDLNTTSAIADDTTLAVNPDTTPPAWAVGWPQATQLTPTSFAVRTKTDESGNAYYVVLATGATAPTAAQVKAGNDGTNSPALKSGSIPLTANTETAASVSGLTTNTTYHLYFVAEDAALNLQTSPSMVSASLVIAASESFMNQSATLWGTGLPASPQTGTASAKTVHFVSTTTGVEFDVTFTTASGNLQLRALSGVNANPRDHLADSGGDGNWFEGPLTITVNNFAGANPADITFRLLGISGQRLVTNDVSFSSSATPLTTKSLGAPGAWGAIFTDLPLDSTAANMAAGSYTATLTWVSIDPESSGLYKNLSFEVGLGGGNTFAAWIGGYNGLNGLTGFGDDADGDGLENGLENFLGTAPNAGNAGLAAGTLSGNTFTFTHPQNAAPASDVSAPAYTWSTDLANWNASNDSSGGITVNLEPSPNTPSAGTTTVTATVTAGTVPPKLFVRLGVSQL